MVTVILGCSSGPGAPLVRHAPDESAGPFLAYCRNVSSTDQTNTFITNFYLTTWFSAWRESAAAAYTGGLETEPITGIHMMVSRFGYSQIPASAIFCRSYNASTHEAFTLAAELLTNFGYYLIYVSEENGQIETDFVHRERSLSAGGPQLHRWKDRFVVAVDQLDPDWIAVRVFRDIHISRCSPRDGCSAYVRATSVGHNEATILNLIGQSLEGG
jgi:hypothetical protein